MPEPQHNTQPPASLGQFVRSGFSSTGNRVTQCAICKLDDGEVEVRVHTCGHTFGDTCLLAWVRESNTCPTCTAKMYEYGVVVDTTPAIASNDFVTSDQLAWHDVYTYACPVPNCNRHYRSAYARRQHAKRMPLHYTCRRIVCTESVFASEEELEEHARHTLLGHPYCCPFDCGYSDRIRDLKSESGLWRHLDWYHKNATTIPCHFCSVQFSAVETAEYAAHRRQHIEEAEAAKKAEAACELQKTKARDQLALQKIEQDTGVQAVKQGEFPQVECSHCGTRMAVSKYAAHRALKKQADDSKENMCRGALDNKAQTTTKRQPLGELR